MVLYISVFGESILNDGVAVVLYQVFESFLEIGDEAITFVNLWRAVIKFSIVAGGGTLMGCVFGYLGSFVFKVNLLSFSENLCLKEI
jgi:NhaP-type Na+/H+ or K+/H+ antiporter